MRIQAKNIDLALQEAERRLGVEKTRINTFLSFKVVQKLKLMLGLRKKGSLKILQEKNLLKRKNQNKI